MKKQILDPKPEESDDDIPDLINVDAATSVSVECCEDPVELVLRGVELVHAVSLILYLSFYIVLRVKVYLKKFIKAQFSTFVFIKYSEE